MYLLEPKVCQYILVVETKEICYFLTKVDENGLYDPKEELGTTEHYKNKFESEISFKSKESKQKTFFDTKSSLDETTHQPKKNSEQLEIINEEVGLDNHIPDGDE